MTAKRYLGDGVYVDVNDLGVVLTTETGIETTNRIVLEPDVLAAFFRWFAAVRAEAARQVAARN